MTVEVDVPRPTAVELVPQPIPLEVLHEDGDIIVVNKQAGLVVHPAAGHPDGTLVNALLNHCGDLQGIGGELRPGIVHRLDRDTSGVLVAAKNQAAQQSLVDQFKAGRVEKVYLALVTGAPSPPCGTVETLIGRSRHDRKKMSARPASGRKAVTHYETLETFDGVSLLKVCIDTGRTHQIRVHMAHLRHPVLGDRQYGSRRAAASAPRQMLHARRLAFTHPRHGGRMECRAPVPSDMQAVMEALRSS
jgi:23S rRNA pseudouridine1911/1915/1917 synthase